MQYGLDTMPERRANATLLARPAPGAEVQLCTGVLAGLVRGTLEQLVDGC